MSGQKIRAWKARPVICAAVSMISYAALTTGLAAQERAQEKPQENPQDKPSSTAPEVRPQQSQQSVALPHTEVRRPKPQPRRRVTAASSASAPAAPPVVQAERGTGPVR